jgi:transcriptional regulator with XRE-family HTH domain
VEKQPMTFGKFIAQRRKQLGLSQKEVAAQLVKEDGGVITPQYLNDIEHGRRNPPSETLLKQLNEILQFPDDHIFLYANRLPPDLVLFEVDPGSMSEGYAAFLRAVGGQRRKDAD